MLHIIIKGWEGESEYSFLLLFRRGQEEVEFHFIGKQEVKPLFYHWLVIFIAITPGLGCVAIVML